MYYAIIDVYPNTNETDDHVHTMYRYISKFEQLPSLKYGFMLDANTSDKIISPDFKDLEKTFELKYNLKTDENIDSNPIYYTTILE